MEKVICVWRERDEKYRACAVVGRVKHAPSRPSKLRRAAIEGAALKAQNGPPGGYTIYEGRFEEWERDTRPATDSTESATEGSQTVEDAPAVCDTAPTTETAPERAEPIQQTPPVRINLGLNMDTGEHLIVFDALCREKLFMEARLTSIFNGLDAIEIDVLNGFNRTRLRMVEGLLAALEPAVKPVVAESHDDPPSDP